MTTYEVANHFIDQAVNRAGSVAEVDRQVLERRIFDHYVIVLAGIGKSRKPNPAEIEEAQAALKSGVRTIIDRRLRAKCARKVESRRLGVQVTKVAASKIKRKGAVVSSMAELVNQTGNEIKAARGELSELRDQVEESVELRAGALKYFRDTDTPMTEQLGVALEKYGHSEEEFYQSIAV